MKFFLLIAVVASIGTASASWYWPFGSNKTEKKEQPRLSELMEPASLLIDEASDLAAEGKTDKAVDKYREALARLQVIEIENADRAKKPEFATLRNKRAYVSAAIDALLLVQVRDNAKAVAVSDTTELEKRLADEKKAKLEEKREKEEEKAESEKGAEKENGKDEETEDKPKKKVKRITPTVPLTPRQQAMVDIQNGDYEAATKIIDKMLEEKPNGAAALNLKAVMEAAQEKYKEASDTLDQAIMSNPRNHFAYYNMARVLLARDKDSNRVAARRYYETGRAMGGPADNELEAATK